MQSDRPHFESSLLLGQGNFFLDFDFVYNKLKKTTVDQMELMQMQVLTVTDSAVSHLRELITTLQLKPGSRINEAEWSNNLGISRPPLREALRILENEQLVVSNPRKGAYVAELTLEGLRETCKARMMIECQAIDFLSERNIRDLAEVESSLASACMMTTPSYSDPQAMMAYLKNSVDYHAKLVRAAKNRWLVHFYGTISPTLIRYQFICLYTPGQSTKSREEHEQILNLIKDGKYERAKYTLNVHINSLVEILESRMSNKLSFMNS